MRIGYIKSLKSFPCCPANARALLEVKDAFSQLEGYELIEIEELPNE